MSNRALPLHQFTTRTPRLNGRGDGAVSLRAASPAANGGRKEALLIDAALADGHVLAAGARPGMAIAAFGGQQDGLTQLLQWTATAADYDALHLVCHGAPASLRLGTRTLDAAALQDAEVQAVLAAIGLALRPGACVLLYACEVAGGADGAAFVAGLAQALGAPVTAASGVLGAAAQGGSWTLDHAAGTDGAAALAWPWYAHTLTIASTETTFNAPEITGGQNYNYAQVSAGYATPYVLSATDVAASGWDVVTQSSSNISVFAIRGIGFGTNGYGSAGEGDSNALRVQANDVDYTIFKSNAGSFSFDLNEFYLRNNVAPVVTVEAVDRNGNTVGSAVSYNNLVANSYNKIDLSANTDFRGIFGFKISFGPEQDAPYFDTIRIANITTAPTAQVNSASLSADTGALATDFVTKTAAQTISGTLSANLGSNDRVEVSFDGGATWQNATSYASGASSWSTTTTLAGSGVFQARVINSFGSSTAFSHSYTLDTVAPTTTVGNLALSSDTGASASDFVTQTGAQTITATLGAGLAAGDALYASKDNGATWTDISASVSGTAVSWSTTLSGGSSLRFKVTDLAGNDGPVASHTYLIDTTAPTTTVGSLSFSADTGASASDFITRTAAQTIGATLSAGLAAGESLYASKDNGATWTDISASVSGTAVSWNTTLSASGTLKLKVVDLAGNDGNLASQIYTLDISAPAAPSTPDLDVGSDSGSSGTDNLTNVTTPVIRGTAESGSTVTLYDSNGTTLLGTAVATGGNWSITTTTLGEGTHNLTAKATDAAGNVSSASSALAIIVDTTAPGNIGLSSTSTTTAAATSGAALATLSATDSNNTITYALAAGNGSNDADNGSFTLSGSTFSVGGSALSAGTYHVYLSATDAAGNVSHLATSITVQTVPTVSAIVRAGGAGADLAAISGTADYTVTFSESVTGVDLNDFTLTPSGTATGTIASVSGSGTTYTVTVNGLGGDGSLRLDLKSSGTGIQSSGSVAIGSGYTAGQSYTLDHTAPAAPGVPDLAAGSDSGSSTTDNITSNTTPTITGSAETGSTVTLYDSNGTTVLGTAVATGGAWSISAATLSRGTHNLTAKAVDAAGNVSAASSALAVTVDTSAPTSVALSSTNAAVINASPGAALAMLSSVDSTAVTYALAVGNGLNDADNAAFAIVGNSLNVNNSQLSAGTYHIYLSATDAAGNVSYLAQTMLVQNAPAVTSIVRAGGAAAGVTASATSVSYTVTFSESVTGVDLSDFTLTASGNASGAIASVTGSGSSYTVLVNTLGGDGSLRLDLKGSGTGIQNGGSIDVSGGYLSGQSYSLDHTAPGAPTGLAMTAGTDSGISSSDAITSNPTPTFTGVGEANATVRLYDTDGTTVLGVTTADGSGHWSMTSSTLSAGTHTVRVKQTDAAGNVSAASTGLTVVIDTSAAAPATPLLDSASDSGASGDGITNVATPTIKGVAEAQAAITLYDSDGVTVLGTTTADSAGNWSIVSSSLSDGSHTLTVIQTDRAGNVSVASAGLTLQIDTLPPSAPSAPVLAAASDSGALGDNLTNVGTPVLTGTAAANAVVRLYDSNGTTVLGTTTADGAGNWSITSGTLSVGAHTLTARQFDAAGNASMAGAALNLTIETPPAPPSNSNTIDGVVVTQQAVTLPGGGGGVQTVIPIVTPGRTDTTGSGSVADIPLVTSGTSNLLTAQLAPGLGLTATGGASAPAGSSTEQLIRAILAATPDHPASDQGHLTGNGVTFLNQLANSTPLLVQTIVPVSANGVTGATLTLNGISGGDQHTALVIDASQVGTGNTLQLNTINFAAIIGAASVTGNTDGQILTGDQASQQFTVAAGDSSSVFAGGGGDVLVFSTPATQPQASGAQHAGPAAASSILHGGLDADTAKFNGASTDYIIEQHHAYLTISAKAQPQQQAVVINIEKLQFADTTLAVQTSGTLDAIAGVYQNVLGRQADYQGIDWWAGVELSGATLGKIAVDLISSAESQQRHAMVFNGDSAHDIELLYQGIFNRHSDAEGLAFWQRAWDSGMALEAIADQFMHAQEGVQHKIAGTGWDFLV